MWCSHLVWWNGIENHSCYYICRTFLTAMFNLRFTRLNIVRFYEYAHRKIIKSSEFWMHCLCIWCKTWVKLTQLNTATFKIWWRVQVCESWSKWSFWRHNYTSEGRNKESSNTQYIYVYSIKHRQLQIFFLPTNHPKMEQTSNHTINAPSIETLKDRLKAMPPTRAWMHQCILYISIYTPDLFCKS